MPISEDENKAFEELVGGVLTKDFNNMEKKFEKRDSKRARNIVISVITLLVGVVMLVTSVVMKQPIIGILGFIGMVASVSKFSTELFVSAK
jgi:uncharacterized Tic20 family protein